MITKGSIESAMKNGNVLVNSLSKSGLFVEAGLATSLLLALQGLWFEREAMAKSVANATKSLQSVPADVPAVEPDSTDGTRDGV